MLRSTDHGKTWEHINNGIENKSVQQVKISNNSEIVISTYDYNSGTVIGNIYKSSDQGNSWMKITDDSISLRKKVILGITNDGTLFINQSVTVGTDVVLFYYYDTDNGHHWIKKEQSMYRIASCNNGNSVSIMKNINNYFFGIYFSVDNAISWKLIQDSLYDYSATLLLMNNKGFIFAFCNKPTNTIYSLMISKDNGNSWSYSNKGLYSLRFNSITLSPKDNIYLSSQDGINISLNDGKSWERIEFDNIEIGDNENNIKDFAIDKQGYLFFVNYNNIIYKSKKPVE